MQTAQERFFDDLVEQFLEERLPGPMAAAISFPDLPPDTRDFIFRMFSLMKRARYSATGFSPYLFQWLSISIPSLLPSAWGGNIPPITIPDRHKKLDEYVAGLNWTAGPEPNLFVDVGCGFPPVTTADTASRLRDWQVVGVDMSFAEYILFDAERNYACFNGRGEFLYFQAIMTPSGRALYANPEATRNRFKQLFQDLSPLLRPSEGTVSASIERNGNRLIHHYVRNFETDNLTFIKSEMKDLEFAAAKVIRCMNLFLYFTPEVRKKMLRQAGELLDDDGILIFGTNGLGIQARYVVFEKRASGVVPKEFAFSLDNLSHLSIMAWFTIHEDDPEAGFLAELMGAIRSGRSFWVDFSQRQDELLREFTICERTTDGFLQFTDELMPPGDLLAISFRIWRKLEQEGYLDGAVDTLKKTGYEAWRNEVGHIAVLPPAQLFT